MFYDSSRRPTLLQHMYLMHRDTVPAWVRRKMIVHNAAVKRKTDTQE